jgi:hypothetical protein
LPSSGRAKSRRTSKDSLSHMVSNGLGSVFTRVGGLICCRGRGRSAWHVRTSGPVPFLRSVLLSLAVPPAVRPAGRSSRRAPLRWNPSTPALDTDGLPGAARASRASTAKALRLHFAAWRGGRCTSSRPLHVAVVSLVRWHFTSRVASRAAPRHLRLGRESNPAPQNRKGTTCPPRTPPPRNSRSSPPPRIFR